MQVGQAFVHRLLCEIIDTVYNNIDDMFLIDYLWSWFRLPFASGECHGINPPFLLAEVLISQSDVCIIQGVDQLKPARIRAESIRAGAAILLAALAAKGESIIENAYQIDRGYEHIEDLLRQLGADATRIETELSPQPIW